ncbi:glycosyl hydrolase [Plantibacter sp. Mn2098]|uniref:glycosyl hydrolase n=1 Tax=Plantibacter sp. Mn2098 TaxID=3395266 RepID=UPI003BD8A43A
MSSHFSSWWATSKKHSRGSIAAASGLVAILVIITGIVWVSPEKVQQALVETAESAVRTVNPLALENDKLQKKVDTLQGTLSSQKTSFTNERTNYVKQLADQAKQLASAQQRATSAERALADAKSKPATQPSGSTGGAPKPGKPGNTGGNGPTPVTAPSKEELVSPTSRYFGLYTEQAPFNWATLDNTAAKIGVQPGLVGYFQGWDQPFRADAVTRSWQKGALPMMTWESRPITSGNDQVNEPEYTLPKILGDPDAGVPGAYDDYIRQYAKDIVANGLPLAMRFNHEMNGIWYPWSEMDGKGNPINGNRPGDYVKVWKHVHDIFEQEGANSLVIWVWAPNIINNLPAHHQKPDYLASLFPGDDYVDWVGLSGYLRPAYKPDNDFTFGYTFNKSLNALRALTAKPIVLAEVGASETGGHKPAWVKSVFDGLSEPANADVIGISWFSLAVTTYVEGVRGTNDWRVDSRADSLAAFIAGLTKPEANFDLRPPS